MKENLEALLASLGCLPLLAVGLFLTGALIGEFVSIKLPPLPACFFIPIGLFPLFSTLYFRAYRHQNRATSWLNRWSETRRKQVVGRQVKSRTVEEVWLESNVCRRPDLPRQVLNNTTLWQGATIICLLVLAYICVGWGLEAADR